MRRHSCHVPERFRPRKKNPLPRSVPPHSRPPRPRQAPVHVPSQGSRPFWTSVSHGRGRAARGLSHLPSPTHRGVPETRPCRSRCQDCIPSQDRRLSRGVGAARPLTRSARMDVGWRPLLDDRACGRCAFLVFPGAYLEGELLGHVIDCVTVPPATCEGSSVCTTLAAVRIFIITILVGLKWYFMASMCISLTTRDAGHLSTCLLASMCLLCRNSDPMLSFDWVIRLFALCVF